GAAGDDQPRALTLGTPEDQRLRDLVDLTADGARRPGRGARGLLEGDHLVAAAGGGQRLLDAADARAEVGHEPSCRTARATSAGSGRTWMLSASCSQRTSRAPCGSSARDRLRREDRKRTRLNSRPCPNTVSGP